LQINRVIHVITTIELGGAEKQLLTLVREQLNFRKEVIVIPLKGNPDLLAEMTSIGAKVTTNILNRMFPLQIILLRHYLKNFSKQDTIVHAHLPRAEMLTFASVGKLRYLVTRHNTERFFPDASLLFSRYLSKMVLRKSTLCIAISPAVSKYLKNSGEINSKTEIIVIPYGYDPVKEVSLSDQSRIRKSLNSNLNGVTIGTIGRLTEQKDYPTLLKSFHLFLERSPGSQLIIIGVGELESELKEMALALNIEDNIQWVGKTQFINEYLSVMDLFLLTSIYEGFGLVLLEAMQMQIPIVASNNSAIPEVLGVEHPGLARTGDHFDFALKMNVLFDKDIREKTLEVQRNQLQLFSPSAMALKIEAVYENVFSINKSN
jgi:glycosyltransferase involved in cell wall biosynthesis